MNSYVCKISSIWGVTLSTNENTYNGHQSTIKTITNFQKITNNL